MWISDEKVFQRNYFFSAFCANFIVTLYCVMWKHTAVQQVMYSNFQPYNNKVLVCYFSRTNVVWVRFVVSEGYVCDTKRAMAIFGPKVINDISRSLGNKFKRERQLTTILAVGPQLVEILSHRFDLEIRCAYFG